MVAASTFDATETENNHAGRNHPSFDPIAKRTASSAARNSALALFSHSICSRSGAEQETAQMAPATDVAIR